MKRLKPPQTIRAMILFLKLVFLIFLLYSIIIDESEEDVMSMLSMDTIKSKIPLLGKLSLKPVINYAPTHNTYISAPPTVIKLFDTIVEADVEYFDYTDYIITYINSTMSKCVGYFRLTQYIENASLQTKLFRCDNDKDTDCETEIMEYPVRALCYYIEPQPWNFVFTRLWQVMPFLPEYYATGCAVYPGYYQFTNFIPTKMGEHNASTDAVKVEKKEIWKLTSFLMALGKKIAQFSLYTKSNAKPAEHVTEHQPMAIKFKPVAVPVPVHVEHGSEPKPVGTPYGLPFLKPFTGLFNKHKPVAVHPMSHAVVPSHGGFGNLAGFGGFGNMGGYGGYSGYVGGTVGAGGANQPVLYGGYGGYGFKRPNFSYRPLW